MIVLMTPLPKPVIKDIATPQSNAFVKRVVKRAFERSQMTTELVNADDRTGSPSYVATSPFAAPVFHHLANRKNKPAVPEYVNYYYQSQPSRSRQSGSIRSN